MARNPRSKAETKSAAARVRAEVAATEELPTHEKEAAEKRAASVSAAVGQITAESALKNLTDARLKLGKVFDDIGSQVIEQTTLLANLKEQNKNLTKEIEELHGKEVIASSLKDAIAEHDAKVAELENEISSMKAAWEQEQADHNEQINKQIREANENRRKEETEYNYNLSQNRKKAEDAYNFQRSTIDRANQDKDTLLKKGWDEREAALKAKETEFVALKARVDNITNEIKAEVNKEVAIATSAQKRTYEHEKALADQVAASEKRLSLLEIAGLKETIAKQASDLAKLSAELGEARKENVALATKALESSSGQATLAAMKDFQAQQAASRPNSNKQ
jgi:hypothetical protein